MRHPHTYSLELLKLLIEKVPPPFPEDQKRQMLTQAKTMGETPSLTLGEIEETMISFGREIWPYRKAYEEIEAKVKEKQERASFLAALPLKLKEKYLNLKEEGLGIREYRLGGKMEAVFSSDEKWEIDQAVLKAKVHIKKITDELIAGLMREEYSSKLQRFSQQLLRLKGKIEKLREFCEAIPRLKKEITEKAHAVESGFALLERESTEEEIDKVIEYYQGIAEGGVR